MNVGFEPRKCTHAPHENQVHPNHQLQGLPRHPHDQGWGKERLHLRRKRKRQKFPLGELFKPDSPEYILKHAHPILDRFKHNIGIDLAFPQVRPNKDYSGITGAEVHIDLKYAGREIPKPHLFLNEARLSAIALSIYLGLIKRHIQGIPCKILFLDDVFIGLDISNRLPLLEILKTEFPDYQIFVTTYDKPWFEYAKQFLEQAGGWKNFEFYVQDCHDGTQCPVIFENRDLLPEAEAHFNACDYKAAAVYTRSAFEKIVQGYCDGEKKVTYRKNQKKHKTEDFWEALKADLTQPTRDNIETYRSLVMNPFSHYNSERPEIRAELQNAIQAVRALKAKLCELSEVRRRQAQAQGRSRPTCESPDR